MSRTATRKPPIRTCIACRSKSDKAAMVRFVRSVEGQVSIDVSGRAAGRGAYLCLDPACLMKAGRSRGLVRALRVELDGSAWEGLERAFLAMCNEETQGAIGNG